MSTYGIATYRPDGSVMMDGLTRGGVFRAILTFAQGSSGTQSYPDTSGSSLYFYTATAGSHTVSVGTDANGAGCINWTATAGSNGSTKIYVFASKVVTADAYGIVVVNDQGETLADHGYPAPQYLGKVSLNATATANYTTPDGYTAYVHSTANFTLQDASDKVVLLAMPDSGTADTWYALSQETIQANVGVTNVLVTVYTKTSTYAIPTLHVYAINHPTPSSSTYGVQLKDASQNLTWDSSVESVSVRDALTIAYPSPGSATNTYSLAVTSMPGVSIPFYYRAEYSGSTSMRYVGVAKKVNAQITFGLIMDAQSANSPVLAAYALGSQTGRYCPVVDLSQLAPATPAGTPGGATWTTPTFTTQPAASPRVTPGGTLTLTVVVAGNPTPTLQWYQIPSGGAATAISGATSATLNKVVSSSDDNSQFYCVAHNIRADVSSSVSNARVTNNTVPVITSTSGSQSIATGTSITVSFAASGTPTPTCSIAGPNSTSASGSGSASLNFTPATAGQYQFSFTASNSEGQVTSSVTITVSDPPVFATQPQSQSVNTGATVSLTVSLSGAVQNTAFQWYRKPSGGSFAAISGATTGRYDFVAALSNNGDQYYCVATNSTGSTQSNTATITVTQADSAPTFASGPTATNMDQGGSTTLTVSAGGYPAPTISWSIGGTTVGTGSPCTVSPSGTGQITATCTLTNRAGTATATVYFFVYATFSVSVSPANTATTSGSSVTLTASAPGANHSLLYQWTGPNGYSNIQNAVTGSSQISITAGSSTVGTYTATVSYTTNGDINNGAGTISSQSHSASATVGIATTPTISQQPSSVSVTQNGSASFSVTASPATSYQWYRDSTAISGATGSSVSADTSTVGSFTYFCIVYNGPAATQSSSATLTVSAPAAATYPSYNGISGDVEQYSAPASFAIYSNGGYDGGTWANGSGDGTLYDVMATGSAYNSLDTTGYFGVGVWYSFAQFGGVGWGINPTGGTGNVSSCTLSISVRISSTGQVVSSGSVFLKTQNGGVQA